MKKQSRHPLRKTDSELTKKDSGRGVELSAPPAARARENAAEAARTYFGSENGPEANRRSARAFLIGAAQAAVIIPILFYLQFGVIDSFALSFTGLVVLTPKRRRIGPAALAHDKGPVDYDRPGLCRVPLRVLL